MERSVCVGRLKYLTSHTLMKMSQVLQRRPASHVLYLGHLSTIILVVALGLGLYTRWQCLQQTAFLIIAFTSLVILSIACALIYYFSMENFGTCLARLWIGGLLGIVSLTSHPSFRRETTEEVMNTMLLTSLGTRWFWNILERLLHVAQHNSTLLSKYESLELLGMIIATMMWPSSFLGLGLLILAYGINISIVRLKSFMAVLSLISMVILTLIFYLPRLEHLTINYFALSCFAGRLVFEPIVDLYFSGQTTLERWQPILKKSRFVLRLVLLSMVTVQLMFLAVNARQVPGHKEWYVVVPLFGVFAGVWVCFHFVLFITCWQIVNKVTLCYLALTNLGEQGRNINSIFASKGLRHLSLLSQRWVIVTFICTVVLGGLGWNTRSGTSLALWFMVLPVESGIISLLYEMGSNLGGTCTGYAVVVPSIQRSPDSSATILPADSVPESTNRATAILNRIQRFMSHHLIDTYGCDYSSSGLTADALHSKLRAFFQRRTSDGPKFDTYLLYYSGQVHSSGDWALADDGQLKLQELLEWWREENDGEGTRLILVLDTTHSHLWLRDVQRLTKDFVAVQTCLFHKQRDPESGDQAEIGEFTMEWVTYNCLPSADMPWSDKDKLVKAAYSVSRSWTDFTFHLPTDEDISSYWDANFPRLIKPLMKATYFLRLGGVCCCSDCILRCLRRTKMKWLPPKEYDTGHGFKLVRS